MTEEEEATLDDSSDLMDMLNNDTMLLAGIVISGIGALWASLAHGRWLLFVCFILLGISLIYIRFPKSWTNVFWLVGIYSMVVLGMLFMLGWAYKSWLYILLGIGISLVGMALAGLFLEHIKEVRDEFSDKEYVSLGLWGLSVMVFLGASFLSAYGLFAWTRGGSTAVYVLSEGVLVLAIPYVLLKTEAVGAGLVKPEDLLYFGEERCPVCDANLSLETKRCTSCNAARLFKWCPICESYAVVCPGCKERTLWLEKCTFCGEHLPDTAKCRSCGNSADVDGWSS